MDPSKPESKTVNQNVTGENSKAIYLEKNDGTINIYSKESPSTLSKKSIVLDNNNVNKYIQNYYQKHFSYIPSFTGEDNFPIEDIFVNLAIIREQEAIQQEKKTAEKFSKDKWNLFSRSNKHTEQEEEPPQEIRESIRAHYLSSYEEIYSPKESVELEDIPTKSNRSLILGKAGIGKTTLCRYICYRWSNGKLWNDKFDTIVYIELRLWKSIGNTLEEYTSEVYCKELFLQNQIVSSDSFSKKTLWLLDGFDELDSENKKKALDSVKNFTYTIFTSRPYSIHKKDIEKLDETFENIGFTDENIQNYIDQYFRADADRKKDLSEYIRGNFNLYSISHIPIILEMICSLWKKEKLRDTDIVLTQLYTLIVEDIFYRSMIKQGKNPDTENLGSFKKSYFGVLGKIAYHSLKEQNVYIDGNFISENLSDDQNINDLLSIGFLKGDSDTSLNVKRTYQFLHLTFQEYFTAYYVTQTAEKESSFLKNYFLECKYLGHFQMVHWFLTGLHCKSKEATAEYLELLLEEPKDYIGAYGLHLILGCSGQIPKTEWIHKREDIQKRIEEAEKYCIQWKLDWIAESMQHAEKEIQKWFGKSIYCQHWLEKLNDKDYSVRREAVESLGKIKNADERIVSAILDRLKDEDYWVIKEAVEFLGKIGNTDERIINILLNRLDDIDRVIRGETVEFFGILGKSDERVIDALLDRLNDEDSDVREKAVESLGKIGNTDERVIKALLDRLKDENYSVKEKVSKLLDKVEILDDKLIPYLFGKLKVEDRSVKEKAFKLLDKVEILDDKLIPYLLDKLKDEDSNVRKGTVYALGNLGNKDERIINILLNRLDDIDRVIRGETVEFFGILGKSDERITNFLIFRINDEDSDVRRKVSKILGNLGKNDEKIIITLLIRLSDQDKYVRIETIKALEKLGKSDERVINALLDKLNDKDSDVRKEVIELLGKSDERVILALLDRLNDEEYWVREETIKSLVKLGNTDERVILALLYKLNDDEYWVSEETVKFLGKLKIADGKVINALLNRLNDKEYWVRRNAVESLVKLGNTDEKVIQALLDKLDDEDSQVREETIKFLGKLKSADKKVVNALLDRLNDKDSNVRWRAVESLGKIGNTDERVIDALLDRLNDKDSWVRQNVVESLGELGHIDERIIQALFDKLKDENYSVKEKTSKLLDKIKILDDKLIPYLLDKLKNEDYSVREKAVEFLGKLKSADERVSQALLDKLKDEDYRVSKKAVESLGKIGKSDERVISALLDRWNNGDYSNEDYAQILYQLPSISIDQLVSASKKISYKHLLANLSHIQLTTLFQIYTKYPNKKILKLIYHKSKQNLCPIYERGNHVFYSIKGIEYKAEFSKEKHKHALLKFLKNYKEGWVDRILRFEF